MNNVSTSDLILRRRSEDEATQTDARDRAETASAAHAAIGEADASVADMTDYLVKNGYLTLPQAATMWHDTLRAIYRGFRRAQNENLNLVRALPSTELSDDQFDDLVTAGERAVGRDVKNPVRQLTDMIRGPQIEQEKRLMHVEKLLKSYVQRLLDVELAVSRGAGEIELPEGITRDDLRDALSYVRASDMKWYGVLLLALRHAYGDKRG